MRPAHLTPSGFADMMTNGRGKDSMGKTCMAYVDKVVMNALGVFDDFETFDMKRGTELEPDAILAYERENLVEVQPKARITHPDFDYVSGEPDGLIGEHGVVEIKCPKPQNHLANIINGEQISLYKWQMQGYLWITGREWCDFCSYHPDFPVPFELSIHRVHRDDEMIKQLEERCKKVWQLVQQRLEQLQVIANV